MSTRLRWWKNSYNKKKTSIIRYSFGWKVNPVHSLNMALSKKLLNEPGYIYNFPEL
jgi:hypothetical protein